MVYPIGVLIAGLLFLTPVWAQVKPLEKVPLATGSPSNLFFLPAVLAQGLGYFKDEGLDVEIQAFKGGAQIGQALAGASIDFGMTVVDTAVKANSRGTSLKAVALLTDNPPQAIIVSERLRGKVKTVADLRGRTIGVSTFGSGTHLMLNAVLQKNGIPFDQVKLVQVGTGTLPAALEQGSIDAGSAVEPSVSELVRDKRAFVLVDFRRRESIIELFGVPYPNVALMTREEVIRNKPELVQRMVNAVVRSLRWLNTHTPEEISAKVPKEYRGTDIAFYTQTIKDNKDTYSVDGMITEDSMRVVIRTLAEFDSEIAASPPKPQSLFDMRFVKNVPAR